MTKDCRPLSAEEYLDWELSEGGWYNIVAFDIMRQAGVHIFDTYKMTQPLWQYHMSQDDCTHFCNPSAYELWMYLLHRELLLLKEADYLPDGAGAEVRQSSGEDLQLHASNSEAGEEVRVEEEDELYQ